MGNGLDREDVRSSSWAGRGVAEVMGLDQEDDRDRGAITMLLLIHQVVVPTQ
jgi:hypothetical protein